MAQQHNKQHYSYVQQQQHTTATAVAVTLLLHVSAHVHIHALPGTYVMVVRRVARNTGFGTRNVFRSRLENVARVFFAGGETQN